MLQRIFVKPGWDLGVLEQLVECRELAAIPHIVPMLVIGAEDEVTAGARAIDTLLSCATPEDLVRLDETLRSSGVFASLYYEDGRRKLKSHEIARWVGPGEPGISLLRLSSFNPNGFIREAAVGRLSLIEDGSELPYLLIRLNDWVMEVRKAAETAVLSRIGSDYIDHFIKNLALVVRLESARRTDHGTVMQRIAQLLSAPASRPSLLNGLNAGPRIIRRACFRFVTTGRSPDILRKALDVKDPVIRLWATRLLRGTLPEHELEPVLLKLSRDRSAPVRREALREWADLHPAGVAEQLRMALMDSARSVREEARFHLHRMSDPDLARFYRDALATDSVKTLAVALFELGETGGPADVELVLPYLSHPTAKIRRTSIHTLMKLGGRRFVDAVFDMVLDASAGVSTQARRAILPYVATIGAGRLWSSLQEVTATHARLNLLRLIAALPKWESIGYLVLALRHEEPAIPAMAARYVVRWDVRFNRSQSVPSLDQLNRLETALSYSTEGLSEKTLRTIRFAVDSFKHP